GLPWFPVESPRAWHSVVWFRGRAGAARSSGCLRVPASATGSDEFGTARLQAGGAFQGQKEGFQESEQESKLPQMDHELDKSSVPALDWRRQKTCFTTLTLVTAAERFIAVGMPIAEHPPHRSRRA